MLAPIGFYYSTFHAGYAFLNAVPGLSPRTFDRMGHSQLAGLIESHLNSELRSHFEILREVRETINYLGVGEPNSKLKVVRGHPFGFTIGSENLSYVDAIEMTKERSRAFLYGALDQLSGMPSRIVDAFPRRADDDQNWLQEYIQEDMLLNVIGGDARGRVMSRVLTLLA
jgi:hypothetical protein